MELYEQNGNILYILNVLKKYSNVDHLLKISDIKNYVKELYDVEIDPRTIRRNINLLKEKLDYDIETWNDNRTGYYLLKNPDMDFESGELRAIIDTFSYSTFIPESISKEIISKCKNMQNVYENEKLKDYRVYSDSNKSKNIEIVKNIEDITEAIYNKKKIKFDYYKYELNPLLKNVNTGERTISPYAIVYQLQEMYVVGLKDGKKNLYTYRIDRMKNINITKEKVNDKITSKDVDDFVKSTVSMFGSTGEIIEVICDMKLLDNVIDLFGETSTIRFVDKDHFSLKVNKDMEGFKRYVLRNLDMVKVISPISLKREIEKIIKNYLKNT
ncbi:MAG: WYL domain-containing protein [Bacilli bacterium]|nr:WYL domain-containing protein [Bacilli bacterium]